MKNWIVGGIAVALVGGLAGMASAATVDGKVSAGEYTHEFTVAKTGSAGFIAGAVPNAKIYITQDASNNLYIALVLPRAYCDNTYGGDSLNAGKTFTSSAWPGNHNFSDLDGSDQATFNLKMNNTTFFAGDMDYLEPTGSGNTTQVGSAGFTGGEGGITTGNSAMILAAQSSMGYNWKQFGYNMLDKNQDGDTTDPGESDKGFDMNVHSPEIGDNNYTVTDSDFADWQFDIVYEFKVAASAFGNVSVLGAGGFTNGFSMNLTFVHASPNTSGSNQNGFSGPPETTTVVPLHPAVYMGAVMMALLAAHQVIRRRRAALAL